MPDDSPNLISFDSPTVEEDNKRKADDAKFYTPDDSPTVEEDNKGKAQAPPGKVDASLENSLEKMSLNEPAEEPEQTFPSNAELSPFTFRGKTYGYLKPAGTEKQYTTTDRNGTLEKRKCFWDYKRGVWTSKDHLKNVCEKQEDQAGYKKLANVLDLDLAKLIIHELEEEIIKLKKENQELKMKNTKGKEKW